MIFKNRLKHLKRKCFSVLRQKQSCSHGVKNGCKNLQRFSFKPLKPFCLSSEQGLKGTQMQIRKSQCMFVFIQKQYPENFAFLILRFLELFTREV